MHRRKQPIYKSHGFYSDWEGFVFVIIGSERQVCVVFMFVLGARLPVGHLSSSLARCVAVSRQACFNVLAALVAFPRLHEPRSPSTAHYGSVGGSKSTNRFPSRWPC